MSSLCRLAAGRRGFTDCSGFSDAPSRTVGPVDKRQHLYQFWKTLVRRPMVLVGASLGGAVAMDFALQHPEVRPTLLSLFAC